ncbi:hypothetical protein [Nonomuraea dietziae]|uniref:hypothetical protein n=1 Tax=Nonomuraea dietziae TaxID=65515 RepID=UPI0031D9B514
MTGPNVEVTIHTVAGPELTAEQDGGISLTIEQHDHVVELELAVPGIQLWGDTATGRARSGARWAGRGWRSTTSPTRRSRGKACRA